MMLTETCRCRMAWIFGATGRTISCLIFAISSENCLVAFVVTNHIVLGIVIIGIVIKHGTAEQPCYPPSFWLFLEYTAGILRKFHSIAVYLTIIRWFCFDFIIQLLQLLWCYSQLLRQSFVRPNHIFLHAAHSATSPLLVESDCN